MNYLVTSIGSMSAGAVIAGLLRQPGAVVHGCNIHPPHWTAAARLVDSFHQVPPATDTSDYLSRLLEICVRENISHILPLTDPEVDILSCHRQLFEKQGIILCISSEQAILLARDKMAIHHHFSDHPFIRTIPTATPSQALTAGIDYPLLAKPRFGRSSEGHITITDPAAMEFWQSRIDNDAYIIQPRLRGDVYVTDVVRTPDGRMTVAMARRELLRTPNGAGMTVEMAPGHPCCALACEAVDTLGLHGCVNLEFLVVESQPLLMDVNPRFSAGIAFTRMAGYDMVTNHMRCFDSNCTVDPAVQPPKVVYARGLIEYPPGKDHAAK